MPQSEVLSELPSVGFQLEGYYLTWVDCLNPPYPPFPKGKIEKSAIHFTPFFGFFSFADDGTN